jgi:hypothetical protein
LDLSDIKRKLNNVKRNSRFAVTKRVAGNFQGVLNKEIITIKGDETGHIFL